MEGLAKKSIALTQAKESVNGTSQLKQTDKEESYPRLTTKCFLEMTVTFDKATSLNITSAIVDKVKHVVKNWETVDSSALMTRMPAASLSPFNLVQFTI